MRIVTLLALGACTAEPNPNPLSDPLTRPPPVELGLDVSALIPGETSVFEISGALPGEEVWLLRGRTEESGPCIDALDGLCLEVSRPRILGTTVADAVGSALFEVLVPETAPLGFVGLFQAVSDRPQSTPVVTREVQHADAIFDFSLIDVNTTSATFDTPVSPRDYLGKVSGWYFGHAT